MSKNADGALTFTLRMAVGSILFLLGLRKILMGSGEWTDNVVSAFAASAPYISLDMLAILAWVVLIGELVLGVLILMGWKTRSSFVLAGLLFALVNIGFLLSLNYAFLVVNLVYILACVAGAFFAARGNMWSVD